MLDKDNRGLRHVQHLLLQDHDQYEPLGKTPDIPEAAVLIHLLPKNILKKVDDISIDELIGSYSSSSCLLHGLHDVEHLRIMPGSRERMPQVACDFFKAHATIRSLHLDLMHMASATDEGDTDELHTSGGGMHALFGSLQPSSARLHTLELTGVNLHASHGELLTALDLQVLSNLSVTKCEYPEEFFTALGEKAKHHPISLKSLTIHHSQPYLVSLGSSSDPEHEKENEPLLVAIDSLLTSLNGCLKEIWIYLRGFDCPPHVEGLIHHGSALQWLFVDARKEKGTHLTYPYSLEDWQRLCNQLKNIQQLDMIFPNIMADCRLFWDKDFSKYVEATAVMKTLTTLGINNWPERGWIGSEPDDRDQRYVNNDAYRHCLSCLATEIANLRSGPHDPAPSMDYTPIASNRQPGLRVVSFGLSEELNNKFNMGFRLSPMCFVKSRVEIMGGEVKWKMEPVTRHSRDPMLRNERVEYDLDGMAHEIGKFEFGVESESEAENA
ncbi:MAG: hypothetical protein Q9186_007495 [Xanthomendoza sp. 1 TL-2023]